MSWWQAPQGTQPEVDLVGGARPAVFEQWREAAKRVGRKWDAWLASEEGDRRRAYSAYVEALAQEELAAWRLERATRVTDAGGGRTADSAMRPRAWPM